MSILPRTEPKSQYCITLLDYKADHLLGGTATDLSIARQSQNHWIQSTRMGRITCQGKAPH